MTITTDLNAKTLWILPVPVYLISAVVCVRRGSRCWALWAAVRSWENFPSWRLRRRPRSPWKSWPRVLRTWHTVRPRMCHPLNSIYFHVSEFFFFPKSLSVTSVIPCMCFRPRPSDVFSSCYRSNESRSFTLLIRKSPVWGGTTCLQMGMGADARLFFSNDGVQVCFLTSTLKTPVEQVDASLPFNHFC